VIAETAVVRNKFGPRRLCAEPPRQESAIEVKHRIVVRIRYHRDRMARTRDRLSVRTLPRVLSDLARFVVALCRPRAALAAENLFLKKQLALYIERQAKPGADAATRIALVALSRLVDWRRLLTIVYAMATFEPPAWPNHGSRSNTPVGAER
jgi:hypothetical protein